MYRFLNRAILAVFFMSIITACGEGDTGQHRLILQMAAKHS